MAHTCWRIFVRGAVAAAFFVVGLSAQAAVYFGSWDPPYGTDFSNLGFAGEGTFFVPDACLAGAQNPGTWIGNNAPCSSGGMSLLTAKVDFYNVATPSSILETLTFAPPPVVPDPVLGVYVEYNSSTGLNEVTGVDTDYFGPQLSNLAIAGNEYFYLQFISGFMPVPIFDIGTFVIDSGAFIYPENCSDDVCQPDFTRTSNPGDVTFTRVPEPGSLALLLGALGMSFLARRRRAAA